MALSQDLNATKQPHGEPLLGTSDEEEPTKNNLNTFNGCYIPCLLNILGAVLFLRVGFSVGQMGFWGALGIFSFSEFIAYLTITSFSAIVTNGKMKGGGAYFMISRNLGPAFGGSSGLLFWFTYCLNVTFNTVSFTQTIQPTFFSADSFWGDGSYWSQVIISTITLFILFLVAYAGAGAFAKVNYFIFAALVVALIASIGSLFFNTGTKHLTSYQDAGGVTHDIDGLFSSFSFDRLKDNMWPNATVSDQCSSAAAFGSAQVGGQVCNLQLVFSIIFPAVVGMMEGANLSGDLRDPAYSIPSGTVAAVSTAFVCYILLIVGQAGAMNREALQYDMNVMQHSTVGDGYFVVTGVTAACLSTALGSMFGSARILQAIARDEIFPFIGIFKKGTVKGDEPRNAVILSYLIAQTGILLGNLDDVAPVLTNFFLLTYCLVNLACFLLTISSVPNFRPTWRYYSWQTSLLGTVLIVVVMFYLQWIYALITWAIVIALFLYVTFFFKGGDNWIDIRQALFYKWSRGALLTMEGQRQDTKYWRPSLLLVAPNKLSVEQPAFVNLLSELNDVKKSGVFVVGQALCGESMEQISNSPAEGGIDGAKAWLTSQLARVPKLKAFQQVAVAPTARLACQNLFLGSGLGSMVPDTVALPLFNGSPSNMPTSSAAEYVGVMCDALALHKNLLLTTNYETAPRSPEIHAWILGGISDPESCNGPEESQVSLILQLAEILWIKKQRKSPCELRIFQLVSTGTEASLEQLKAWLKYARIPVASAEVVTVDSAAIPATQDSAWIASHSAVEAISSQLVSYSSKAATVLLPLPSPMQFEGSVAEAEDYVHQLGRLTAGLSPTILTRNGQGFPVITTEI